MGLLSTMSRKVRTARHLALLRIRPPAARRQASRFIAKTLPRPIAAGPEALARAADLDRDGFVMLSGLFEQDKLVRLRRALETHKVTDGWRPHLGTFDLADAPAESNNVHIKDVESIPEAVEIANDPRLLEIVSAYLGCKPTVDDVIAWWSLPGRTNPFEEQFYHRDQDSIRFLKFFLHLTDVGDEDGPHVFVRGSHRSNTLLASGKRFSDEQVAAAVAKEDVVRFTGPVGTCFLEDTYGIHKGEKPGEGMRLMFQVRYTMLPSMFATPGKKKGRVEAYDPYVNRLIAAPGT